MINLYKLSVDMDVNVPSQEIAFLALFALTLFATIYNMTAENMKTE